MSKSFEEIGAEIGKLVDEKNESYGSSYAHSSKIIQQLYPNGVQPHQYQDMLVVVRIIDKLFRIANRKDAFGESPWKDIAGYGILGEAEDQRRKESIRIQELLKKDDLS